MGGAERLSNRGYLPVTCTQSFEDKFTLLIGTPQFVKKSVAEFYTDNDLYHIWILLAIGKGYFAETIYYVILTHD